MGLGDRELHALVGADGPAEDHALARVGHGLLDEPAAVTDRLRPDQDALGVHAIEDVGEPLTRLADQAVARDLDVVEEERVRRVVHHHPERANLEAFEVTDVGEEDREAVRPPLDLIDRRRPRQEQHEVRLEHA